MTPRSDPHTETIREALELLGAPGHGVTWSERQKVTAALTALADLESERDELLAIATSANDNTEFFTARAVAAEARVTQLEDERDAYRDALQDGIKLAQIIATHERHADTVVCVEEAVATARSIETHLSRALGVVADGGGGQDD